MKLNLGCGNLRMKGYVNCDFVNTKATDKVFDLTKYPYPFKTDSISEVILREVLEHLPDTIAILKEVHRILAPGGLVKITVPYYLSVGGWSNPEHKRAFNYQTFKYFIKNTPEQLLHNFGFSFSSGQIRMTYGGGKNPINYICPLLTKKIPDVIDKSFLKFILTPDGIEAMLVK